MFKGLIQAAALLFAGAAAQAPDSVGQTGFVAHGVMAGVSGVSMPNSNPIPFC